MSKSVGAFVGSLMVVLSSSCAAAPPATHAPRGSSRAASAAPSSPPPEAAPTSVTSLTSSAAPTAESFSDWLRKKLPEGGELVDGSVVHTARAGDTADTIAAAYIDVTTSYLRSELSADITKKNALGKRPITAGARIAIPNVRTARYEVGERARLPKTDEPMRGLYIRGDTAGRTMFVHILDRMAERGINAIVLDAKDYDGVLTYASKVPLAIEAGAIPQHLPIRDMARAIRAAHDRGIRVLMRISCFEDEWMAKAQPRLSVQAKWGRAYPIGWLDPSNEGAQNYIIDLVKEAIELGADEIQLDYVRYPVLGIKGADFKLVERNLTQTTVIRDFVRRVHQVTQAHDLPLSLDVFGVIAFGHRVDIDALGQDPALLAPECEALSPMVYPSHYTKGFHGWDEPGDHPEIVGLGTKGIRDLIGSGLPGGAKSGAVIRPWLQAMKYKSPAYSPKYLADEIKAGDEAGGVGWLMWNPGQDYDYAWTAVPKRRTGSQ
jgi:hypothetical protein